MGRAVSSCVRSPSAAEGWAEGWLVGAMEGVVLLGWAEYCTVMGCDVDSTTTGRAVGFGFVVEAVTVGVWETSATAAVDGASDGCPAPSSPAGDPPSDPPGEPPGDPPVVGERVGAVGVAEGADVTLVS